MRKKLADLALTILLALAHYHCSFFYFAFLPYRLQRRGEDSPSWLNADSGVHREHSLRARLRLSVDFMGCVSASPTHTCGSCVCCRSLSVLTPSHVKHQKCKCRFWRCGGFFDFLKIVYHLVLERQRDFTLLYVHSLHLYYWPIQILLKGIL